MKIFHQQEKLSYSMSNVQFYKDATYGDKLSLHSLSFHAHQVGDGNVMVKHGLQNGHHCNKSRTAAWSLFVVDARLPAGDVVSA